MPDTGKESSTDALHGVPESCERERVIVKKTTKAQIADVNVANYKANVNDSKLYGFVWVD